MALEVNIEKKLGDFHLSVAFSCEKEFLGILGASGSGKSMTLKCIAGIEKPDRGKIVLDGRVLFDSDTKTDLPPQQRRVGYLFQHYALFPGMTVRQNILSGLHGERDRRKREKRAEAMMDMLQIRDIAGLRPFALSGGQAQRTALGRILVNDPELLMLDEPFSALDAHLRLKLQEELKDLLAGYGKGIIMVTHDRDEAFRMCDRIGVMEQGRMETVRTAKELYEDPKTGNAAVLTGRRIKIRVLILAKFEVGQPDSGFPGEARYYYERYLKGADSYEVPGGNEGSLLYVREGVALYVLGMGKINAALSTMAVLSDRRFDFSEALILSTGCAGSAAEYSVMGDVFVITAAVDYDMGHHADIREMTEKKDVTWFHDRAFDSAAPVQLNRELADRVYELVKDLPMETTERTRKYLQTAFSGAAWTERGPMVLRGTSATGDNYWKGRYGHENAQLMVKTYGCPDPYAVTEMEDIAVCRAAERMGMLDRLVILRGSVNMDVFMGNTTPESLWHPEASALDLATEDNTEAADIFPVAMKNIFTVGSAITDAVLNGKLPIVLPGQMRYNPD